MIKSIRTKLFLVFISLMAFVVFGGILLNVIFLEKYYIHKNKNTFIEVAKIIEAEYKNEPKRILNFISIIYKSDGIACYIVDENYNVVHYSVSQKEMGQTTKINKEIQSLLINNREKIKNEYIYDKVNKENEQIPKIIMAKGIANNEILILTKPIKGIKESAQIANQFYLIAGVFIILCGSIVIFIFSNKISKPIVKMSRVAENISNLNFQNKIDINSNDEIGSLGESINNISRKLSISMKRLTDDIELRKELVRNMSHELKTPIGVIKGYSEGIKYGVAYDEEKMYRYCTVIAEECDRMDNLVKELLQISKLEEIAYQLTISTFNIEELMINIKERFIPIMKEKDIKYKFIYNKDIAISADFDLVERAITNYITNAIKYSSDEKYIEVQVVKRESKVEFSVYNTGKAIKEEDLKKIWDVFYKVERARTREDIGHGLGLAIVKRIVELHGGSVGVENHIKGIKFKFTI